LRAFLARYGISASKGLGQHFLCSGNVVEAISLRLAECKGLLEIGPGPGVLTAALSEQCEKMIALEVDPKMGRALAESAPRADVRLADALKTDLFKTLSELPMPRGVVSNLPYYITGPLVARIAEASTDWDIAVLMMQREVAARIVAPAGDADRGSLSVFLQSQFRIEKVADVPPSAFLPPPKVDSTVLEFRPLGVTMDDAFYAFVRAGFKQPRKTLANNLLAVGLARDEIESRLKAAGLEARVRPHALTLEQWRSIATRGQG
jgi:16S rRNA (adenine1518-N6/adenine1519-N6)-dimethyltransferase